MATVNSFQIQKVTAVPFRYLKKKYQSKIVCSWLVISILCMLPTQDHERDEFIQFCRSYCQERVWLDQISEFERQYRPDESIRWYTHSSGFPSKLINAICRTQNPILISKIRYFLKHIHEQLARLYLESLIWIPNCITVYRGQTFSSKDFKRLLRCKGKKIFTTTLLSTTCSSEVAGIFSGSYIYSHESSKDVKSVVFKIIIETKTARSKPFAYIQEYTHIKAEKEILLSIGTIFSCVDIREREVNFYEILLIHGRDEEEIEKKLLRTVVESHDHGKEITVNDFLNSMNIHTTPLGDFHRQPFSSLFDEIRSDTINEINEVPIGFPFTCEGNLATSATDDHLVIWLDDHIGMHDFCMDLKETLSNAIHITIDEPQHRNEIDRLIQNDEVPPTRAGQFIAVTTMDECLALIDNNYHWAFDFTDNLLMFDFHDDLLGRVVYEIGMYYMQKGIIFSGSDDHPRALYCFYLAKKLVMRANFTFKPNFPFSLTKVEEFITKEEAQLPRYIVRNILNYLSYR